MVEFLNKIRWIIGPQYQRRFFLLVIAFFAMGVLELVGIASIMPFMQLVAQPDVLETNELLRSVYDRLGFESREGFLIGVGVALLVLLAATNLTSVLVAWLQQRFVWRSVHYVARRLLRTFAYQPYEFFVRVNSADLSHRVLSEVDKFAINILFPLVQMISGLLVATIICSLLIAVDATLAIIVIAVLGGGYGIVFFFVRRALARLGRIRMEANRRRFRSVTETFSAIKVVKVSGREKFFLDRFDAASNDATRVQPTYRVMATSPRYLVHTLAFGGLLSIVIYLIAVGSTIQKVIPILSLYALAGYRLMPFLQNIFGSISTIRFSIPIVETLYDDLTLPEPPLRIPVPDRMALRTEIRLDGIGFTYQGTTQSVLADISLSIPKGSSVAFVGPTGSGKTTLVDIVTGLLTPQTGRVLVDGDSISPENARAWQASIGYVPQDVTLLDDTIRNNIVLGVADDDVDEDRLVEVARLARIHDLVVNDLPKGYSTLVGERGVRLSGGQRQRIGLARALYHRPDLLILDEATSALDGITEDAVLDAIKKVGDETTVVMIAHRLTTVRECDQIYLLEQGRIVASGKYDDLLIESPTFRDMAKVTRKSPVA